MPDLLRFLSFPSSFREIFGFFVSANDRVMIESLKLLQFVE